MSYESFDVKFSSVACVVFVYFSSYVIYPPKYFKVSPGHEGLNVFQNFLAMGFCADLHPVNGIH